MAGWAGSTMVWVTYDRYINGPPPDALSVRVALSSSLSPFLSSSLSLSPCSPLSLPPSPSLLSFSLSFCLHALFSLQPNHLARAAAVVRLLFSDERAYLSLSSHTPLLLPSPRTSPLLNQHAKLHGPWRKRSMQNCSLITRPLQPLKIQSRSSQNRLAVLYTRCVNLSVHFTTHASVNGTTAFS